LTQADDQIRFSFKKRFTWYWQVRRDWPGGPCGIDSRCTPAAARSPPRAIMDFLTHARFLVGHYRWGTGRSANVFPVVPSPAFGNQGQHQFGTWNRHHALDAHRRIV
jgi:hypothetical protein